MPTHSSCGGRARCTVRSSVGKARTFSRQLMFPASMATPGAKSARAATRAMGGVSPSHKGRVGRSQCRPPGSLRNSIACP